MSKTRLVMYAVITWRFIGACVNTMQWEENNHYPMQSAEMGYTCITVANINSNVPLLIAC